MLNYHLLSALKTVIEEGSFLKAAKKLHITQSAISQRIQQLEDHYGEQLIFRTTPPTLSTTGQALIAHTRRVEALEHDLKSSSKNEEYLSLISLGVNADSVATWFFDVFEKTISSSKTFEQTKLQLIIDYEELTFERMRLGEVLACISSMKKPLPGCESELLGEMKYVLLCSDDFYKRYFRRGFSLTNLNTTPAVLFDSKDKFHEMFLKLHFGKKISNFPVHYVPSSEGFYETIKRGFAYGVVPQLQATNDLKFKTFKNLSPKHTLNIPLYWHSPRHLSKLEVEFKKIFVFQAKRILTTIGLV
jgi:LysR family transcriptional regulator (chromosome initiation inhibitor)